MEPLGFQAGDANLRRYVGNAACDFVDPSGLWKWKVGDKGQLLVVSEEGDKLNDLIGQGYDKNSVVKQVGKDVELDSKLKAGVEFDFTAFLPQAVRDCIARQQNLSLADPKVREVIGSTPGSPKKLDPKGILGAAGLDLMQDAKEGEDGLPVSGKYNSFLFGWGNCYGFVALCLGAELPKECSPENLVFSALRKEGVAGADDPNGFEKPGSKVKDWGKENGGVQHFVCPEGGLLDRFTKDRKVTKTPDFGAVALFKGKSGVTHAAFVLGHDRDGKVYLIQKLNAAEPITISTTDHPRLKAFGEVSFYGK